MLITGSTGDSVAGLAYLGQICTSYGIGWAGLGYLPTVTAAHELGHNFNIYHDDSEDSGTNIMSSTPELKSSDFSSV